MEKTVDFIIPKSVPEAVLGDSTRIPDEFKTLL